MAAGLIIPTLGVDGLVAIAAAWFLVFVLPVVVGCWLLWALIRRLNRPDPLR